MKAREHQPAGVRRTKREGRLHRDVARAQVESTALHGHHVVPRVNACLKQAAPLEGIVQGHLSFLPWQASWKSSSFRQRSPARARRLRSNVTSKPSRPTVSAAEHVSSQLAATESNASAANSNATT